MSLPWKYVCLFDFWAKNRTIVRGENWKLALLCATNQTTTERNQTQGQTLCRSVPCRGVWNSQLIKWLINIITKTEAIASICCLWYRVNVSNDFPQLGTTTNTLRFRYLALSGKRLYLTSRTIERVTDLLVTRQPTVAPAYHNPRSFLVDRW